MSNSMKPIQATPKLRGKDAEKLFHQVNVAPIEKALEKNKELLRILNKISKTKGEDNNGDGRNDK